MFIAVSEDLNSLEMPELIITYRLRNPVGEGKTTGTTNAVGLLLLPPPYRGLKQYELRPLRNLPTVPPI